METVDAVGDRTGFLFRVFTLVSDRSGSPDYRGDPLSGILDGTGEAHPFLGSNVLAGLLCTGPDGCSRDRSLLRATNGSDSSGGSVGLANRRFHF